MHMMQTIKKGFNEDQVTDATLLDLEGVFDAIWRDRVIYQLKEVGVTDRLLKYTISFFTNSTSRNLVNMRRSVFHRQGCPSLIYR